MNAKQYNIGFIGLGLMGKGFTERLVKKGHSVIGYDLDFKKVEEASVFGVRPGKSPADVASQSDIVMLCVTSTAAVEDVIFGPEGVSKGTPVTISGFNVGSVQDIKFYKNTSKLLLKFRVENDFTFSKNSIAQIYETGLIGGKALSVIPKYGEQLAKNGDTLKSSIAPGLTELVNDKLSPLQEKIESMVVSADSVLLSLNSVLNNEAKLEIQSSITNFSSTVADLKSSRMPEGLLDHEFLR